MKKHTPKPSKQKRAAELGVTVRTLDSRIRDFPAVDFFDNDAVIAWAGGQLRLTDKCRSAIDRLGGKGAGPIGLPTDKATAQHWLRFTAEQDKTAGANPGKAMAALTEARDFSAFMFKTAAETGDQGGQRFYAALLQRLEGCLHDAQIRAQRLGLDTAQLYPRSDMEHLIAAWCYWGNICTLETIEGVCRKLIGRQSYNEVRDILEPYLLTEKFIEPFKHALTVATGMQLPAWFTAKLIDSVDDFINHGAEQMRAALAAAPAPAETPAVH